MTRPQSRDRGDRPAQVVRRPRRARRHRPDVAEGTIFALLGPNGAGKTTIVQILSTLIGADGGDGRASPATTWPREPDAVRAAIGVTGQFSAVDDLLTGEENLLLMADLHHLGRRRGPPARRRAARAVRPGRRGRRSRRHLLRRHAAPARPGDDPGRRPADHLPRRADHRPRPAQPPHHVADHPRPRRRRRHDLPHHPVPRGGRPARRPDRGARPRQARRRGHRRTSSSGSSPAATSSLRFADADELDAAAARARRGRRATTTRSTLQVPERRRRPRRCARCSTGSTRDAIEVDDLTVHTPDLDDVFLALTGHPTPARRRPLR